MIMKSINNTINTKTASRGRKEALKKNFVESAVDIIPLEEGLLRMKLR